VRCSAPRAALAARCFAAAIERVRALTEN
jgi:hypothetical protein